MLKQTDATLLAWLTRAVATGGPYDPVTSFVGVASAVADHGAATVLADVTEGTGAVATRVEVTAWSDPYKETDGRWVVDGPPCVFSPASSAEAQSVSFWFIASLAAAGVLKAWGALPALVPLADDTHRVTVVPRITIDPLGRFSAEIVWNG